MTLPTVAKHATGVTPVSGSFSQYLGAAETAVLIALVRRVTPLVMIEIGCNDGLTAKNVLRNVPSLQTYVGIDVPYGHRPLLSCQDGEVPRQAGHRAMDDLRFYLLRRAYGSMGLSAADLEPCDAVFIDGDHSHQVVLRDSRIARELIRPGGVIVWHDYTNPAVEVTHALDDLHVEGWPLWHVEGTWLAYANF